MVAERSAYRHAEPIVVCLELVIAELKRVRFGESAITPFVSSWRCGRKQDHRPPAKLLSEAKFASAEGMAGNAVDIAENCLNFDTFTNH